MCRQRVHDDRIRWKNFVVLILLFGFYFCVQSEISKSLFTYRQILNDFYVRGDTNSLDKLSDCLDWGILLRLVRRIFLWHFMSHLKSDLLLSVQWNESSVAADSQVHSHDLTASRNHKQTKRWNFLNFMENFPFPKREQVKNWKEMLFSRQFLRIILFTKQQKWRRNANGKLHKKCNLGQRISTKCVFNRIMIIDR